MIKPVCTYSHTMYRRFALFQSCQSCFLILHFAMTVRVVPRVGELRCYGPIDADYDSVRQSLTRSSRPCKVRKVTETFNEPLIHRMRRHSFRSSNSMQQPSRKLKRNRGYQSWMTAFCLCRSLSGSAASKIVNEVARFEETIRQNDRGQGSTCLIASDDIVVHHAGHPKVMRYHAI